ncbi:MAG: type IX secretion system sortase PorU [Bacteroidales bacterium]|nr:type IX secretion system sortase PorU [Bacteroidales bacterium]
MDWRDNLVYAPDEHTNIELLYFTRAITSENYPGLPLFYDHFNVDNFFENYQVSIIDMETREMSAHDAELMPADYNLTALDIQVKTSIDRKKNVADVTFIPIIKESTNKFRQVTSITIAITPVATSIAKNGFKGARTYASHSVLSSGNWYKISISQTGLHKVTFEDLQSFGITSSVIPSSQISLFGNGGTILPEANSEFTYDDLQENPIMMVDGGDGVFGSGDYFVFYGSSPHVCTYSEANQRFSHRLNPYSDQAYYFINVDMGIGEGKRIQEKDHSALTADGTATTYTHYAFFEEDKTNLMESGILWFGDLFDVTAERTYTFSVPGITNQTARVSVASGFVNLGSSLSVSVDGSTVGSFNSTASDISLNTKHFTFMPNSSNLTVKLKLSKSSNAASMYLNWIEIEAICDLRMHSAQFSFTSVDAFRNNQVTEFTVGGANSNTTIWDVTEPVNPVKMKGTLENGSFSFKSPTDTLRRFVAFNGSSYLSVTPVGSVANQNLHNDQDLQNDLIIITHPNFTTQANRLAEYRRQNDNMKVKVVTIGQVYNEFSSGALDPTAIRNYMRMIYDKTDGIYPKYLLLVGKPSFDYRSRGDGNVCYIPNYQLDAIPGENSQRANDDYFGLLDLTEGAECKGKVDIAIGRFPVTSATQANTAVEKSINYSSKQNLVTNANSTQVSNLADWRNIITFVADDEDGGDHLKSADEAATRIAQSNKTVNLEKIYIDAYQQVSHSGGQRYPEVNTAINNRMDRGTFLMAYMGHGGPNGWAVERILTLSEINNWTNKYNLTIMMTLTCTFSWYDRAATSPGELVFLNANGGAAGLVTTSRVAYGGSNEDYALEFVETLYQKDENGDNYRLGELHRIAKNAAGGAYSLMNMIYVMGDPTLPLAIPTFSVATDSINGVATTAFTDTVKAYSKVTVTGRVTDPNGNTLQDFNGNIFPSVYDKAVVMGTLENDLPPKSPYIEFDLQKNILFKGNASVKDGHFRFSFIVPRDINYSYGNGKISYYARETSFDAAGYYDNFILGGMNANGISDSIGPEIEVFLNDYNFVNNGTVDQNPILILRLSDEFGINTTGNGIGHDIVAILDEATESPIILNDYYEALQDSFNCGIVRYPLKDLASGRHTLKARAWDIANNMAEKTIDFQVISDASLEISHLLNYPNPFTTHTEFYFEQNQPGSIFDILVQIFTISGRIVKTISTQQYIEGNRCAPISWNGRDDYGDKLAKGVYLYKLKIRNPDGVITEKIEKLVIL